MNTKQLQLVTFEQAKRLRGALFDWKVYNYYDSKGNHNNYDGRIPAPTVALALKWFRDEKKFDNIVVAEMGFVQMQLSPPQPKLKYYYSKYFQEGNHWGTIRRNDYYNQTGTYEAAESALLDELLNILEKRK